MKSKLATIIIIIMMILIISVFGVFGLILWREFQNLQTSVEPEKIDTVSTDEEATVDKDIKTPQIINNSLNDINDGNLGNSNSEINYNNVNVDKYLYNQLEEESKIIYKAFESNKENMKTGTYKVELGNAFSNLLRQSNGQDLLGRYYQSAIEAYTYDNPEVFYLSPNKMYLNIETTTIGKKVEYNVYINSGNESNYLIYEFSSKGEIDTDINILQQKRNEILQNRTGDTYKDIKMVHDYLINNIEYDTTISRENIYNIYGAMINKIAVCEGYARSFKYIMDGLGIPCVLVIGRGTNSEGRTENHAWNYVELNGSWYAIDTTWDDPISNTGWVSEESRHKYFLKGSNEFSKDHTASEQFTEGGKLFNYPILSSNNY